MARVLVVPSRDSNGALISAGTAVVPEEEVFSVADPLQSATVDDNFILSAVNRARVLDLQGREESWLVLAAFLASRLTTPVSTTRVLCNRSGNFLPGRLITGAPTSPEYLSALADAATMVDNTTTMLAFASIAEKAALRGEQDSIDSMMVAALFAQYIVNKTGAASYSAVSYPNGGYAVNTVRGPSGTIFPGKFLIGTDLDVARAVGCVFLPYEWTTIFDPASLNSDRRDARDAQFMMFAIVAQYVENDFSSLPVGALPAGFLPGGGTYVQAVGAGQTEETWVSSWALGTLARMAFVANTPKIGKAPNGLTGLRLRQSWKNYVQRSDALNLWTQTGTAVTTPDSTVSPDGLTNADTLTDDDALAYEFVSATVDAVPNDSETYRSSVMVLATAGQTHALGLQWGVAGGSAINQSPRLNSNDGTVAGWQASRLSFGSWHLFGDSFANNSTGNTAVTFQLFPASTALPLPAADVVAGVGAKVFYGATLTRGKMRRDYQPTGATGATCADCAKTFPATKFVDRTGRLRLRFRWSPSGDATEYNTSNFRIFDHGDETTYVEFSATTQKLSIVVKGGAAEVCNVPLFWPAAQLFTTSHPVVEFDIEIGGNLPSFIRYRYSTDAMLTWTLPFDPMGGTAGVVQRPISTSGNVGILTGVTAGNVTDGWLHEREPIVVTPAWALQALPTDVASVKAFFRADSAYTLTAAGLVSAWGSLSTTAGLGFTQGTGAFQPTFSLTGAPDGRPAISFGTNDSLVGNNRATYFSATDGEIIVGVRINAATLGGAGAYFNFHGIVADNSGGLGLHYRTAGVLDAGNFAGSAQSAQGTYTLGAWTSLRWQHTAGNISLGQDAGMSQMTSVASGATTTTGALCVGNGAVGYLTGLVSDVIICDSPLTTSQLAIIRKYLVARSLP